MVPKGLLPQSQAPEFEPLWRLKLMYIIWRNSASRLPAGNIVGVLYHKL